MSERARIGRGIARVERRIVGGVMRLIAIIAERRVRRSLEGKTKHHGPATVHVDLEERIRESRS